MDFFLVSSFSVPAFVCLLPMWFTFVVPPARPWHHWFRRLSQVSSQARSDVSWRCRKLLKTRCTCWKFLLVRTQAEPESAKSLRVWSLDGTTCPSRSVVPFAAFSSVYLQCLPCRPRERLRIRFDWYISIPSAKRRAGGCSLFSAPPKT